MPAGGAAETKNNPLLPLIPQQIHLRGKAPLGTSVARTRLARNLGIENAGEFVEAAKDSGGYDRATAERLRESGKPVPDFLDRVTRDEESKER